MPRAAAIIVPAVKRHTSTVILAHGLGDTGHGWEFLPEQWRASNKFPETKFILPHAPVIPITVNGGMRMPGWFDITDFDTMPDRNEDEAGILRTQAQLHEMIAAEVSAGISSDRIVLGGFSQGGAMSIMSGITAPVKLAGIFGMSAFLVLPGKLRSLVPEGAPNQATKIFMGHGEADPLVRFPWGRATAEKLREWGYEVTLKSYPGVPHAVCPQELDDVEKFLHERIPEVDS